MEIISTDIPDILIIQPKIYNDNRGFFYETWNKKTFSEISDLDFVQDNYSHSKQNVIRGLHYQLNNAQGKLIQCTKGCVFDVVVDLRKNMPTFGKWLGVELTEENKKMLWVPPGFAHGFYVISNVADFRYKCTNYYSPEDEYCIHWNDPVLNIDWRIPQGIEPVVSVKDDKGIPFIHAPVFL